MLMIRFQPRRVANVVAGLTVFWCGMLSAFFWIKGYNFNFLFLMLLIVIIGFFMASVQTDVYLNNIRNRLGFKTSRGLLVTDKEAFSTVSHGVFSSIGPIPFQYLFPARLNSVQLKGDAFSSLIQSRFPGELHLSPEFLADFMNAIDGGPHAALIRAILEVYCHPSHINLPAGISRHNGEFLLTHCLRVAALMFHRANDFTFKNYYVVANDPNCKISRDDSLLIVVGLAHDLGKVNSLIFDTSGVVTGIKSNHHKSSCRLISSLPEFWSSRITSQERYIIQSACIYSTEYSSSPIQASLSEQSKPKTVSDRLQLLIELTIDCDTIASQIENGINYQFAISPLLLKLPEVKDTSECLDDTKIDLFLKFSEFISSDAIINGKGSDRSVGFKYFDESKTPPKHLLFVDESEFISSFALFLNKPEWAEKNNKSHALAFAVLPKLDEAGYLIRSTDVGAQPAVNCLYKVDFLDGDPPVVTYSLKSCFVLDLTDWPNQNKLRDMSTCKSHPVIINSIFGNKFVSLRRSVTDSDIYEGLGVEDTARSDSNNIESLVRSKQAKNSAEKQLNKHAVIGRIKSGLRKQIIVPAMDTEEGQPIPIAKGDEFFEKIGVKMKVCDPANDEMKALGILSIRISKKLPGTHIVLLDSNIYSTNISL